MLDIIVPGECKWNSDKEEFTYGKSCTLRLEHSLISISKWESKWHKSFFTKEEKSDEETIDYIKCMTITQNVDKSVYDRLTEENLRVIQKYIEDPMTATRIYDDDDESGKEQKITSEIIYYTMISYGIPIDFEKRHLNWLLTLLHVFKVKNSPKKKKNKQNLSLKYAEMNRERRKKYNTNG